MSISHEKKWLCVDKITFDIWIIFNLDKTEIQDNYETKNPKTITSHKKSERTGSLRTAGN